MKLQSQQLTSNKLSSQKNKSTQRVKRQVNESEYSTPSFEQLRMDRLNLQTQKNGNHRLKENVIIKLKSVIQQREEDSSRFYQRQNSKIQQNNQKNINRIADYNSKQKLDYQSRSYSSIKKNTQSPGYKELQSKKSREKLSSYNSPISRQASLSPQIKQTITKQQTTKPQGFVENSQYVSTTTKDSDHQNMQVLLSNRRNELNELDLELLQIKMDIRAINNQILKVNWDHQVEAEKTEVQIDQLKKQQQMQYNIYQDVLAQIAQIQQEENDYQTAFHSIMTEINTLKKIKRQYEDGSYKDERPNQLLKLQEENSEIRIKIINLQDSHNNPTNHVQSNEQDQLIIQKDKIIEQTQQKQSQIQDLRQKISDLKQRDWDKFSQEKIINLNYEYENKLIQLNTQIDEKQTTKDRYNQELQEILSNYNYESSQKVKILNEQSEFVNNMQQKLLLLTEANKIQQEQIKGFISEKKQILIQLQQQIQEWDNQDESNDLLDNYQIKNLSNDLTVNQNQNIEMQDKISILKQEIEYYRNNMIQKPEPETYRLYMEKYENQIQIYQKQIKDRENTVKQLESDLDEHLKEMQSKESEGSRVDKSNLELMDLESKQIEKENQKILIDVEQMKKGIATLEQENDNCENLVIKQKRDIELTMIKIDECSQRGPELQAKLKALEKKKK